MRRVIVLETRPHFIPSRNIPHRMVELPDTYVCAYFASLYFSWNNQLEIETLGRGDDKR